MIALEMFPHFSNYVTVNFETYFVFFKLNTLILDPIQTHGIL